MDTTIFIGDEIPKHRRKKGKKHYVLQAKKKEGEALDDWPFWRNRYKDWTNFSKYEKYRDAMNAKESYERKGKAEVYYNYLSRFNFRIVKI